MRNCQGGVEALLLCLACATLGSRAIFQGEEVGGVGRGESQAGITAAFHVRLG